MPDTLLTQKHLTDEKVTFNTGATSSKVKERFDLICPTGVKRIAMRYALGAEKHGEFNWCKGIPMKERLNHLKKHINLFELYGEFDEEGNPDDNLAAIAWNAIALMHYEDGCKHHEAPVWMENVHIGKLMAPCDSKLTLRGQVYTCSYIAGHKGAHVDANNRDLGEVPMMWNDEDGDKVNAK